MFRGYSVDIDGHLREYNNIEMVFHSPVYYAAHQSRTMPQPSTGVPPACPPDTYHGVCHANFIRKEPCSFSWDWGPGIPTSGVIGRMIITADYPSLLASVQTNKNGDDWQVSVSISEPQGNTLHIQVTGEDGTVKGEYNGPDSNIVIPVSNVSLWWPVRHGEQTLYKVSISDTTSGQKLTKKTGFRTVEIVQDDAKPSGKTFFFRINGKDIFIKGANWIPTDILESRVTLQKLEMMFDSFKGANYNSVRVWGGGIYQSEAFYNLADERGIVIWQESMFACAMYPASDAFLASVKEEITYQTQRLSNHPSIIVWSANNENEVALIQNWYGYTSPQFNPIYAQMYKQLYWDTIVDTVSEKYPTIPVLASSPSTGYKESADDPVLAECNDDTSGDVHVFNYEYDCWDLSLLKNPRFASEFGHQSWSSYSTLISVADPDELYWGSPWTEQRQHCDSQCSNDKMKNQAIKHYNWPVNFIDQIYVTQVQQAYCIRVQVEHHRRNRNRDPHTMGTLYWQANDIWQTVSWSSIEFNGQWKLLHHLASKFYADVMISAQLEQGDYSIFVLNDQETSSRGTVEFALFKWDETQPVRWITPYLVNPGSSTVVESGGINELGHKGGCDTPADCILTYELKNEGGEVIFKDFVFLGSPKDSQLVGNPFILVNAVHANDARHFEVTIRGQRVSPLTWLSLPPVKSRHHFEQNGFFYDPSIEPFIVQLTTTEDFTVNEIAKYLHIQSLGSLAYHMNSTKPTFN
eukprot:TRINITY_DN9397_c0_g1_i1.p1 TRINITY_DN9397_c0_g1~~TRINITY_DN9397_c0_g1_i1.p1  ORF type:complete len:878 (+),score=162.46 TRINITY_DN9397_c0_g1_i1:393-2636(+)